MGIRLNGNTALVVIAGIVALLVVCITVIIATGQSVPSVFTDAMLTLIGVVTGGGVVHQASTTDRQQAISNVQDVVESAIEGQTAPIKEAVIAVKEAIAPDAAGGPPKP